MSFNFSQILTYNFIGNSVKEYLIALGVFLLAIIILKFFKNTGIKKIKKLADHSRVEFTSLLIKIIDSIGLPLYVFLSLYLALQFVRLPGIIEKVVSYGVLILVAYYVVRGVQELIDYGAHKIVQEKEKEDKDFDSSVINLLGKILKGVLWGVVVIIVLQNLGYNISALVASLGIGGIAIAFALQNILCDIFASFSIYFDKPFKVGDFIIVGDDLGVVEKIGIKTTRLQSLWGQEIVISNKELTSTRVNNYKRMEKRRVHFTFGVVYQTSTEKLKEVLNIVEEVFDKIEMADLDRVHFKQFGDFSLNFEVAYYVATGDYNKYMDIQQEINFGIKERFEKQGIEFAYPTQTVFINK